MTDSNASVGSSRSTKKQRKRVQEPWNCKHRNVSLEPQKQREEKKKSCTTSTTTPLEAKKQRKRTQEPWNRKNRNVSLELQKQRKEEELYYTINVTIGSKKTKEDGDIDDIKTTSEQE